MTVKEISCKIKLLKKFNKYNIYLLIKYIYFLSIKIKNKY